jgi:integrase
MATLPRRRQRRAEDLEVVSVSSDEVRRLLDAAESWPERLALGILAYLGPRRHAVALLRLADWDQLHGQIRFREKGGKVIWKPCPAELQDLLRQALRAGVWADCYCPPGDRALGETADGAGLKGNSPAASPYLVPPEGRLRRAERDDRIIWRLVKRVAARAGIAQCTTHALRAAFACFYDEANPGDTLALRDLMGHASVQTTELYLRRRDKQRGMERVRDLSWRRAS